MFNQFGDLERCALRPGNVHSADGWEAVLTPVLARYSADFSKVPRDIDKKLFEDLIDAARTRKSHFDSINEES